MEAVAHFNSMWADPVALAEFKRVFPKSFELWHKEIFAVERL